MSFWIHATRSLCLLLLSAAPALAVDFVVHVSVDGLRPDAVTALGPALAPSFHRLRSEGAFSDNARTDPDSTSTLPNHATQLVGLGVLGPAGHEWTWNGVTMDPETLHSNKGAYVASAFDVAHDHGHKTGLYATKDKFMIFDRSWNETYGAPDPLPPDDGRDKIDQYVVGFVSGVTTAFLADLPTEQFGYAMLHISSPDSAGHGSGWDLTPGSPYLDSVALVDGILGDVLAVIEAAPTLDGRTAVIVTADHGGKLGTTTHDPGVESATIPFYVWGPGVAPAADLYALNAGRRQDPGGLLTAYTDPVQPIRNGDAANLALALLGLEAVPGSTINSAQDLATLPAPIPALGVAQPVLAGFLLLCVGLVARYFG